MLEKIKQPIFNKHLLKYEEEYLHGYTKFEEFEIVNIVGSGKLFQQKNVEVDLFSLARSRISNAGLAENIFPGLRFNIERNDETCPIEVNKLMAHIFKKTNTVIMGAKKKEDIYVGHNLLKNIINKYLIDHGELKKIDNISNGAKAKLIKKALEQTSNIKQIIIDGHKDPLENNARRVITRSKQKPKTPLQNNSNNIETILLNNTKKNDEEPIIKNQQVDEFEMLKKQLAQADWSFLGQSRGMIDLPNAYAINTNNMIDDNDDIEDFLEAEMDDYLLQ